jgi:cytochrome c peroxidase
MPVPPENITTVEGVALGKKLFFDKRLSGDNTISCASCHQPEFSFADGGKALSVGVNGAEGSRNTPALINLGWRTHLFHDGRAESLEEQASGPITNPLEMDENFPNLISELALDPDYPKLFSAAFANGKINQENIEFALAQYQRLLVSNNSKYDKVLAGEASFSNEEKAGFNLFFSEKTECFHCHGTILLTNQGFNNIGLDLEYEDKGRADVTGLSRDNGKFIPPTLRNIELTAPYMHDGRFETLEEVIDFYNDDLQNHANLDPVVATNMNLNADEKAQLLAFLKTLTDTVFTNNPEFLPEE